VHNRPAKLLVVAVLAVVAIIPFLLLTSARERALALNTLGLVAGTWAIALPVGTFVALLLVRTDIAGRRLLMLLVTILLFLPLYVQNAAWQSGFGQQGWWEMAFGQLGTAPPLYQWRGAVWIHAMAAIPWVAFIMGTALARAEPELEEAALVEGSLGAVLWRVTLRRSLAAIIAAALWIGVVIAGEITVTDMWQLRTYAEEIYIGFALGDTVQEVALHTLPGVILVVWLALAALVALAELAVRDTRPQARPAFQFPLGPWKWPLTFAAFAIVVALVAVPVGSLLAKLGIIVEQTGAERQRWWSLAEAIAVLGRSLTEFHHEITWSLIMGSAAALAAVILAVPLASFAESGRWKMACVAILLATCVAIPGPIIGLGLITLFNQPNVPWLNALYDRSIVAPTIALVIRALPLTTLIVWHAFAAVPQATLDLAIVEGATWWQRLWRIVLPQCKAALLAAWLLALAVAIGDLSASFLVLPPGITPLSRRIFEEAHYGVDNRLAGLTLVAMGVVALIAVTAIFLIQHQIAVARSKPHQL
jgi:iron(III) transport system permease protein